MPSLFYYFVGDDSGALIKLASAGSALKAFEFRWPMAPYGGYFRPLQWLPFILGYSFEGLPLPPDPRWQVGNFLLGYHILSLLFHLGNIVLVYLIGRFIFKSRLYAGLAALIFAVHPVAPETVCWVSVFGDLSLVFFSLLALIFFTKFYMHDKDKEANLYYFASVVFFLLALLSKEPAVILPFLFILAAVFLHKKKEVDRVNWERLVYILSYFALIPLYLVARKLVLPGPGIPILKFLSSFGVLFSKFSYYLRDLILPLDYSWLREISYKHAAVPLIIGLTAVFGLFLFVVSLKKFSKVTEIILSLFWITLTLILPLLAPFAVMRRHLYLPLVGFSLLFVSIIISAKRKLPLFLFALLFIICEIWTTTGRCQLFKLSGLEVRDGLVQLQRSLPVVEPESVICIVGIPGVLKNTPSFYADPVDKVRLLYQHARADIFCVSVVTFTENNIRESDFKFIDNYNFVQSLDSNLDEYIRALTGEAPVGDSGWQLNAEGKSEFKVLGRNKYGEQEVIAFHIFPEAIKRKTVYVIGYKDGKIGLIRKYRVD